MLKNYPHSSGDDMPLGHYQALLECTFFESDTKINVHVLFTNLSRLKMQACGRNGYAVSYTMPMFHNGEFVGFLFFISLKRDAFTEKVLADLDEYAHLISLMLTNERIMIKITRYAGITYLSDFTFT